MSEELTMAEDLRISHALQSSAHSGGSSSISLTTTMERGGSTMSQLQVMCVSSDKEILHFVVAAQREQSPFAMVILDGDLLKGKNFQLICRHLWQQQNDLHIVLHAAPQIEVFEQIPLDARFPRQLLVLKSRLVASEISQVIRMVTAKHAAEHEAAHRNLNLSSQLLEMTTRYEEVSNRLRLELDHRVQLEDRLFQYQYQEIIHWISGAMMRYFNCYLTLADQYLETMSALARERNEALIPDLLEWQSTTRRVSDIISQWAVFHNREHLKTAPLHLDHIIDAQAKLMQNSLEDNTSIQINHLQDATCVMADKASLEQIVFNLLMHARDSMPLGGKITVQTLQFSIPDEAIASQVHADARPGRYVAMVVSDTGLGKSANGVARLFDGTQISLGNDEGGDIAMILVLGLVRLLGGWIGINSVPSVGTEFSVYLPEADQTVAEPAVVENNSQPSVAAEEHSTILVVDDEDSVRQIMEYVLSSQGHKVLNARDAAEAWSLWRMYSRTIKLAIIDVKLPHGVTGFDLEKAISDEDPTLPVIFTCGYSPSGHNNTRQLKAGDNFLPKPFGMVELLNIVGQSLLRVARL